MLGQGIMAPFIIAAVEPAERSQSQYEEAPKLMPTKIGIRLLRSNRESCIQKIWDA